MVSRTGSTFVVSLDSTAPSAPTIGAATLGNAAASVAFTPGAFGVGTLLYHTADCGGFTNTGSGSPITVAGLTNGTSYTCKVKTTTTGGSSVWSGDSNLVTPSAAGANSLNVTKGGTGGGTVTSVPPGIDCGIDCTKSYASPTALTLTAAPAAGSVFMGWLGACIGTGPCNVNVTTPISVRATFAPDTVLPRVDVDGITGYDALTDGLLIFRYLSGLTGTALTNGAVGAGSTPPTAAAILQHLDNIRPLLDVDGDGKADAATDGLMLMRYMFGLREPALTVGAIGTGAKLSGAQIEAYLRSVMP